MIRLSENDSVPKVKNGAERHVRLCTQNMNAEKYRNIILPLYEDFEGKRLKLEETQKEINFAQDTVWLYDGVLDNVLRDLGGRAKEFDRNNPGSNIAVLLFPGGNVSDVTTMPDKKEPDAAHSIAQKIISLGESHELYPFAAKIESAVENCRKALAKQVTAIQNQGDAKTALEISKITLVRQYNANYFIAASDVNKEFAEKLFPRLRNSKRKNDDTETEELENDN